MDGRGRATDKIFIERLWNTVKQDYVYFNYPIDWTNLFKGLNKFIENYNIVKTRHGIERVTPVSLYLPAT